MPRKKNAKQTKQTRKRKLPPFIFKAYKRQRTKIDYVPATLSSDKEIVTLDFVNPATTTVISSGVFTYVSGEFNLNNPKTPMTGGVTESAIGFSNYIQRYNRYRVLGVYYDFRGINNTTTATNFYILPSPLSTVISSSWLAINRWRTNPGCKFRQIGTYNGDKSTFQCKGYIDLGRLYGNKDDYLSSSEFTGTNAVDPTKILKLYIGAGSSDGATTGIQIIWNIKLKFRIEFFERNTIVS